MGRSESLLRHSCLGQNWHHHHLSSFDADSGSAGGNAAHPTLAMNRALCASWRYLLVSVVLVSVVRCLPSGRWCSPAWPVTKPLRGKPGSCNSPIRSPTSAPLIGGHAGKFLPSRFRQILLLCVTAVTKARPTWQQKGGASKVRLSPVHGRGVTVFLMMLCTLGAGGVTVETGLSSALLVSGRLWRGAWFGSIPGFVIFVLSKRASAGRRGSAR